MKVSESGVVFSRNLRALLEVNKVKQERLAGAIGVTQPTVSSWLRTLCNPSFENLDRVAAFFNVTGSDLLNKKTFELLKGGR